MEEQQPLDTPKPKINNIPFVKGKISKIFTWLILKLLIVSMSFYQLLSWGDSCAKERLYKFETSFGCDGLLYPIGVSALSVLAGITVLFAIVSFIKKEPNQLLTKLYLIVLSIFVVIVLVMLIGNLNFLTNTRIYE